MFTAPVIYNLILSFLNKNTDLGVIAPQLTRWHTRASLLCMSFKSNKHCYCRFSFKNVQMYLQNYTLYWFAKLNKETLFNIWKVTFLLSKFTKISAVALLFSSLWKLKVLLQFTLICKTLFWPYVTNKECGMTIKKSLNNWINWHFSFSTTEERTDKAR